MNDDLIDFVSREMRAGSADTADCPNLVLRVAAGVQRRRRRQRALGAGLTLVAAAVLAPVLVLGTTSLGGPSTGSVTAMRADSSARADLALRRANPDLAVPAVPGPAGGDQVSCVRRTSCRRPI